MTLNPPRIEQQRVFIFAGLKGRFGCGAVAEIQELWRRFEAHIRRVPGETEGAAYGVAYNWGDEAAFDYMAAVEVQAGADLEPGLERLVVEPASYAVFVHDGHVSDVGRTMQAIYSEGLPAAGLEPSDGARLERYGLEFDPATGEGSFEVWVPLKG